VRNISATSSEGSAIHVFGYDELVVEAQRKQRWATVAVALSGAAGAINAANAGYTHTYGTYSGYSNGTYGGALNGSYTGTTMGTYSATTYDQGRAYAAQQINNAQTAANLAAVQARGEQTLDELMRHKDPRTELRGTLLTSNSAARPIASV